MMIRWEPWILVPAIIAFALFAFGSIAAVFAAIVKLIAVYFLVGAVSEIACFFRNRHVV